MDSPQTQVWGPHLWMILHSSAERIGLNKLKRLPQEESRIWLGLLGSLRYSLPCPVCKKHFTSFFSSNPINAISQEFIRGWLYRCHANVNTINDKPQTVTLEQLPSIYSKPFNFSYHYGIIAEHMGKALRLGWCSREDIGRTARFFQELKRFYDFF